jgi:hypothetical protein
MSTTVAEAQAEIRTLYDKAAEIENRYPDGLTRDANPEAHDRVQALLAEIEALEDTLNELESPGRRERVRLERLRRALGTLVAQFVESFPDGTHTLEIRIVPRERVHS